MADSRDSLPNPNAFDQYMRSNESDIFGDLLDDPAVDVDDHVWRDERLGHGPHNRGFPVSSSAPAIDCPTFDAHITDIPHRHPIESDSSDFTFAISQWPDSTLPELDSTLAASYGTVPLSADNVAHSLPASAAVPQTQPVQQVLANDLLLFPDFDATGTQTNDPIYWPVPTLPFLPTDYIALDEMALDSHLGFQENFSIRGPQPSLPTSLPWIADVSPALLPTFPTNAILPLTIPNALEPFNQSATSANEDRSQPLFPLDVIDSLQSRPYPETIPVEPPVHVAPAALQLRTEPEIEDYFEGPSGLAIYPESTGDGLLSQRPLGLEDPPFEVYSPRTIATFRREVESIISGSSVPSIPPGAPHGGAYITSEDDTQIELIPSSSRRYVCSPDFLTYAEIPQVTYCTQLRRLALTSRVLPLSVHCNLRRLINPNFGCVHPSQSLRIHPMKLKRNQNGASLSEREVSNTGQASTQIQGDGKGQQRLRQVRDTKM